MQPGVPKKSNCRWPIYETYESLLEKGALIIVDETKARVRILPL